MFCQEATDFCITLESKSTSPAPKFSNKSKCFTAAGAMRASTSSEFRDVQSIRRNQFPVTGFLGVTVSNSQVVLVCPSIAAHRLERTTDMFGPRYRTLDLRIPAVGWAVDVEIHWFGLISLKISRGDHWAMGNFPMGFPGDHFWSLRDFAGAGWGDWKCEVLCNHRGRNGWWMWMDIGLNKSLFLWPRKIEKSC